MIGGKSMNRQWAWLSSLVLFLAGCATTGRESGASLEAASPITDPPARDGAPTLFIAMPSSPNFVEVRKSLVAEVQKNFNIHTFAVGPETTAAELSSAIQAVSPVCVVLMNNVTMNPIGP